MIQIQGMSKLLSYEIERNPNKWKEKVSHNKSRSQIENVVRAIIKNNERNKIFFVWDPKLTNPKLCDQP